MAAQRHIALLRGFEIVGDVRWHFDALAIGPRALGQPDDGLPGFTLAEEERPPVGTIPVLEEIPRGSRDVRIAPFTPGADALANFVDEWQGKEGVRRDRAMRLFGARNAMIA